MATYLDNLRKQVGENIVRLKRDRDGIDAQLRSLVGVMRTLEQSPRRRRAVAPPGGSRKRAKSAPKKLTRKQRRALVAQMLTRSGGLTATFLAKKIGCSFNAAWSALEREVKHGRAVKIKRGVYGAATK